MNVEFIMMEKDVVLLSHVNLISKISSVGLLHFVHLKESNASVDFLR